MNPIEKNRLFKNRSANSTMGYNSPSWLFYSKYLRNNHNVLRLLNGHKQRFPELTYLLLFPDHLRRNMALMVHLLICFIALRHVCDFILQMLQFALFFCFCNSIWLTPVSFIFSHIIVRLTNAFYIGFS